MASAWVETRTTNAGAMRYRVRYRVGGAESAVRYAGLFNTKREAKVRQVTYAVPFAGPRPASDALRERARTEPATLGGQRSAGLGSETHCVAHGPRTDVGSGLSLRARVMRVL
jgi:hypothetical protein